MRKRWHLKPNDTEQAKMDFITRTLRVRPEDFLLSLISVHYPEIKRITEEASSVGTGSPPLRPTGPYVDEGTP